MSQPAEREAPIVDIAPRRGLAALDLRRDLAALWEYRSLVRFIAWRDLKVRYKQTVLGGLWAILQPLVTMLLFLLVFSRLASMPSDGAPYALFAYVSLLPWTYFANAVTQIGNSLIADRSLVTKVYFPRVVIPVAASLPGLVDLAMGSLLLIGLLVWYGVAPGLPALWIPGLVALMVGSALGVGLWLSALNVLYRDFRYVIPFLVQVLLFLSPVAYPTSLVPEAWRGLYGLNPLVGVIEGFRWAVLGTPAPGPSLWTSVAVVSLLLFTGALYFRRAERRFADVV